MPAQAWRAPALPHVHNRGLLRVPRGAPCHGSPPGARAWDRRAPRDSHAARGRAGRARGTLHTRRGAPCLGRPGCKRVAKPQYGLSALGPSIPQHEFQHIQYGHVCSPGSRLCPPGVAGKPPPRWPDRCGIAGAVGWGAGAETGTHGAPWLQKTRVARCGTRAPPPRRPAAWRPWRQLAWQARQSQLPAAPSARLHNSGSRPHRSLSLAQQVSSL